MQSNRLIKIFLLITCLGYSLHSFSQKNYTMQEAVLGLSTNLAVDNLSNMTFRPESDDYIFLSADKAKFLYAQTEKNSIKTFVSLEQLNEWAKKYNSKELKKLPGITWIDKSHIMYAVAHEDGKNVNYVIAVVNDKGEADETTAISLPINAQSVEVNPKALTIAYTIDNNLYYADKNNNFHTIAEDKNPHVIYGQSVHRNEFGISKGIFHSPNGTYTAFYRMDESMVADYPIINWLAPTATVENIKYPMAGGVSHHVTLGIYNYNSKSVVYVQTGLPAEQYLTCVTWDPDEKYVYIAVLNRAQNHMKFNKYDAKTGAFIQTLFEEQHGKYVEPQHPLYFIPYSNDFVWLSQRDGYMHAYLYRKDGSLKKQLTKGDWIVKDILGFDKFGEYMYFTSTMNSALGVTINRVKLKNGKVETFNDALGIGVRTAQVSHSGKYIIDNFRNPEYPRIISLVNTENKSSTTLLKGKNTLEEYNNSKVIPVSFTTENQTVLYGKLMLPHDFDSTKKYPVIVYLYNGPHLQLITETFPESGNLWYDYMTQRGFIVWTMDGRGSANRGLEFEQAIHQNLGSKESYDQMLGVQYLKNLPYVDTDRIGIYGWSYGGFMTTYMMTHFPETFKVGVAGGPVIDWNMYEIMYTERYMSAPQNNPKGFESNNLLSHADKLKGKLLMIHGADDDVVVWQHSMKFIDACVKKNIPIDYFAYPGHKHNVVGKDRVHLMQKIADYFIQNL